MEARLLRPAVRESAPPHCSGLATAATSGDSVRDPGSAQEPQPTALGAARAGDRRSRGSHRGQPGVRPCRSARDSPREHADRGTSRAPSERKSLAFADAHERVEERADPVRAPHELTLDCRENVPTALYAIERIGDRLVAVVRHRRDSISDGIRWHSTGGTWPAIRELASGETRPKTQAARSMPSSPRVQTRPDTKQTSPRRPAPPRQQKGPASRPFAMELARFELATSWVRSRRSPS